MNDYTLFSAHGDPKKELGIMYDIKNSDRSPEEKQRIIADMIAIGKQYGFAPSEYLLYDFEHKTPEEKHTYISDKEHLAICRRLNSAESERLLDNKYETYTRFRPFFNRELCFVLPDDPAEFLVFAQRHNKLFIKPNEDWGGMGSALVNTADYSDPRALFDDLIRQFPDGFLAEECMKNAEPFYSLHPTSLNTVRVPTIKLQSGVKIVHPFVRIGCGNAVVDNAASGGIMGLVDPDTGIVTLASNEANEFFNVHPDTGVPVVGMQIPEWDKAVEIAKQLADVLDGLYYCGWDLAYTTRGWVMMEGNSNGQFVWQMVDKKGCRAEFEGYLAALGV